MTRELKLALIVGFSLVLVVTILISDHLSKARKSDLSVRLPEQPQLAPIGPSEVVAGPVETVTEPSVTPLPSPFGGTPLVELVQTRLTGDHASLMRQVEEAGGQVRNGEIVLPPLVKPDLGRAEPIPTAPPVVKPVAPEREYIIAEGDSAYRIAKRFYGNGELWRQLSAYNPGRIGEEGHVRVGVRLKVPTQDALTGKPTKVAAAPIAVALDRLVKDPAGTAGLPKTVTTRTYTVKKGDTLSLIAQRELKSSRRMAEIIKLNPGVIKDEDSVPLGAVIKLPAA